MKKLISILLLVFSSYALGGDVYIFEQQDINENITREGKIKSTKLDDNLYEFDLDVDGINSGFYFSSKQKTPTSLGLWDIHDKREHSGISIFSWDIDPSKYFVGFYTENIESFNQKHPYFKSTAWVYSSKVEKKETLNVDGYEYETLVFHTTGFRPSGPTPPGSCYFGQPGAIDVLSWFDAGNGKLIKQVFEKKHCDVFRYNLLTREVLFIKKHR